MRELAIALIIFASLIIIGSWALSITLAITSGKGILSRGRFLSAGRLLSAFSRQRKHQWLSAADTIAQYSNDQADTTD